MRLRAAFPFAFFISSVTVFRIRPYFNFLRCKVKRYFSYFCFFEFQNLQKCFRIYKIFEKTTFVSNNFWLF